MGKEAEPQRHKSLESCDLESFGLLARQALRNFNASQPRYPTDPEVEEQRYDLLQKDATYRSLGQQFDVATTQEERVRLFREMCARRQEIMTSPTHKTPQDGPLDDVKR